MGDEESSIIPVGNSVLFFFLHFYLPTLPFPKSFCVEVVFCYGKSVNVYHTTRMMYEIYQKHGMVHGGVLFFFSTLPMSNGLLGFGTLPTLVLTDEYLP
jgi:hypothetical protein